MDKYDSTSASLLVRLRDSHDQAAWARFVELYTPLIFYWARRTGLQEVDAADLVQDVLTIMLRKLPEFKYERSKSFRGWLRTITLNKWRERKRRKALSVADVSQSELLNVEDPTDDDAFWESEYNQHLVSQAIRLMKSDFQPKTWEACREFVFSEKSADEVAAEFGVSVWTIYSAKSRMLKRLREELDGLME